MGVDSDLYVEVLRRIADREGRPPEALDPPLSDVVDPESLETLFDPLDTADGRGKVVFTYREYLVTVRAGGEISVRRASR